MILTIILLLAGGGWMLLNGYFSSASSTYPACTQLPTVETAEKALAEHKNFAEEIKKIGDHIEVKVGTSCTEDQTRGLIEVIYKTKAEHKAIDELFGQREGFGVPVYLVKK